MPNQKSAVLQGAEELHREEGVATGLVEKGIPEGRSQPIRFGIHEGLHELAVARCAHRNGTLPVHPLHRVQHLLEGVALAVPAQGDVLRTVGAEDHQAAASELAA